LDDVIDKGRALLLLSYRGVEKAEGSKVSATAGLYIRYTVCKGGPPDICYTSENGLPLGLLAGETVGKAHRKLAPDKFEPARGKELKAEARKPVLSGLLASSRGRHCLHVEYVEVGVVLARGVTENEEFCPVHQTLRAEKIAHENDHTPLFQCERSRRDPRLNTALHVLQCGMLLGNGIVIAIRVITQVVSSIQHKGLTIHVSV
jgi:hypothetical protein